LFRFASSSTGDIHIGSLRIALLNYICAIQAGDKLLIRIEDIDNTSIEQGKEQEMLDILTLFGISYHDITYQSHSLKFHQQLATKLLMDKHAFSCFCTPQELADDKEKAKNENRTYQYNGACENLSDEAVLHNESPFSVRVKRPSQDIIVKDKIKGEVVFKKEEIDSFVILNIDKRPTPDFATAIDDLLGDISIIIQDEEALNSTPKQVMIRNYLGYDKEISYAHLPTLSKSDISVKWLLEEGFLPSAIVNYLIAIGNTTPVEIFGLQEAIEWFDLSKISNEPSSFDINRLREINCEHIKQMPALELAKFIGFSSKDLGELAKIYTEEGSTINEIKPKIDAIFAKKSPLSYQEEFTLLTKIAKEAPFFKTFDDFKTHLESESGLEQEALLEPLRYLLTGAESGPSLSDIYPHIKNYLGEIIR
jgi:glutamyl-tRNA synthetase